MGLLPSRPFKFVERMAARLANNGQDSTILGDLEEEFQETAETRGLFRAHLGHGKLLLVSLPSFLSNHLYWSRVMFNNYLKIAVRNVRRFPVFSTINILGLALGIGLCLVIMLYLRFEKSFDDYHPAPDRTYRIAVRETTAKDESAFARITDAMGPALASALPQVETAGRVEMLEAKTVKYRDAFATEDRLAYADQSIFDIFRFRFLKGDPSRALNRARTVVITAHLANRYFGPADPMGKILTVDNRDLEVTGVIADPPENTHLKISLLWTLIDRDADKMHRGWNPGAGLSYTYIRVRPDTDLQSLGTQINALARENNKDILKTKGLADHYFLQPLRSIHLNSHLRLEAEPAGNPQYLFIFTVIGLLILLVACVNFMNLSTARYTVRTREVGIRKVVGAQRRQLARQFLGETFFYAIPAAAAAVLALQVMIPLLNRWLGTSLNPGDVFTPGLLAGLAGCVLFVGVFAGIYPALFLSSIRPVAILRNQFKAGSRAAFLRRVLVVGQFAISTTLMIGTMVMIRQLHYMKNTNVGFEKEQKLIVKLPTRLSKNMIAIQESKVRDVETVKNEFLAHPFITGAASSNALPGRNVFSLDIWRPGQRNVRQTINYMSVDVDFLRVYGIRMATQTGPLRNVSKKNSFGFLINESAAQMLGFSSPEQALGQEFFENKAWIAGVVGDFHYEGLQNKIGPLMIFLDPGMNYLTLSMRTDRIGENLKTVRQTFRRLFPGEVFDYFFLDEDFNRQYRLDERAGRLAGTFAGLGILIAGLGLFGLASFTTTQRTKEIGIRKVLGATIPEIVVLLDREFAKWVVLANLFAWPVAFWAMGRWLENFAYRTNLGWEIFAVSAGLTLAIALATVSGHAIKAARTDPCRAIRFE